MRPLHLLFHSLRLLCCCPAAPILQLLVNAIKAHGISTVILLTPPPLYEAGYARCNTSMASGGMDRTNAYAQQYALACKQLAQEMELPVVDLWSAMQTEDVGVRRD